MDVHQPDERGNVNNLIERRRSKRAISPESLEDETVESLGRAAHLAPSCFNNQPWRFVFVDDSEKLDRIKESLPDANYLARTAPLIVAITSKSELDCELSKERIYYKFDSGLAVENLLLHATELGLVSHPIAGFDPDVTRKTLGVPEDFELIALIIIGKPGNKENLNEKHKSNEESDRDRMPLKEVFSKNSFDFKE
ncbi:nitroreductase family protein [Candidatus Bipolaricaulota bacterium]|nr:nitroreductase family protein [Candidatus Bipolaricaulota bacterium]